MRYVAKVIENDILRIRDTSGFKGIEERAINGGT